jgi:hypothetical protein
MPNFSLADLKQIYARVWRPGWGSITSDEVLFVQSLIEKYLPQDFLEIGTASGLSGGLIACILHNNGGRSFTTIDYDNTFFGDTSKPNGFLLEQLYTDSSVDIRYRPFAISLDVPKLESRYDMAFIDANHQQPWPIIDTLCIYPFMRNNKIVIHHDLCLFRNQDVVYGIGPKYLFDQFPELARITSTANHGNIFALALESFTPSDIERIAGDVFCLPWSLRTPLTNGLILNLRNFLSEHYSPALAAHFERCAAKFNNLERLRTGV